jgi:hypothetical protein
MTLTSRASYPRMHPFKVHQGLSPQLLMSRRGSKRVALPLAPVRQRPGDGITPSFFSPSGRLAASIRSAANLRARSLTERVAFYGPRTWASAAR